MDVYDAKIFEEDNERGERKMTKVGKVFISLIVVFLAGVIFASLGWYARGKFGINQEFLLATKETERPLLKYTFDNLSNSDITGKLEVVELIEDEETFASYIFEFTHYPDLDTDNPKVTTGLINIPYQPNGRMIMQIRGYVDPTIYSTGVGTRNSGRYYADKGYLTIAPDFLGYADSDENAADIFESRFQTYVTGLQLLKTLEKIKVNPDLLKVAEGIENKSQFSSFQFSKLNLWGHSNGGQIALALLEMTGEDYPTTLWAPVTQGFPYSILYFTDESQDRGKYIRRELAEFEELYNVDDYSLDLYWEKINAPLTIHQGTADDAVPVETTDSTVIRLRSLEKEVDYNKYNGADHNLRPNWDDAVEADIQFFKKFQ